MDRDLHWYTHRVKEAIHIRLHPNNMKKTTTRELRKSGLLREQPTGTARIKMYQ